MKVEIIKDHDCGLKKGDIKDASIRDARKLIELGIAKLVDDKPKKTKTK